MFFSIVWLNLIVSRSYELIDRIGYSFCLDIYIFIKISLSNTIIQKKKNHGWLRFLSSQKKKFVIETDNNDNEQQTTDPLTAIIPNE